VEGAGNRVGEGGRGFSGKEGAGVLATRDSRDDLKADAKLPDDTRLWAALQDASGGVWGGCVFDVDEILKRLEAGKRALQKG